MKNLTTYITEKLSAKDTVFRTVSRSVFGKDFAKTQSEFAKDLKNHVEEYSDGKVSMNIMKVKDIEPKLSDCVNKEHDLLEYKGLTVEDGIIERLWRDNVKLSDDTPFVCFYNKSNNKFYVWEDSLLYFSTKDTNNNRPLMKTLTFKEKQNNYIEKFLKDTVIPSLLGSEK